ncbi:hypothetical protein SDC9_165503 [bioreactor metagenome]|uniref:Uncharacterized protein n=1 Tax=bioreactor metagenome TaxID=1076179 RepID=A0A645FUK6_9ZZZZ
MEQPVGIDLAGQQRHHHAKAAKHGHRERRCQAQVLAQQQLQPRDGQRQQQIERAAFALADDGVKPEQQCDQRDQIDHQTDQTGNGDLDGAKSDHALLGAAEIGDHQREHREHQCHRQHPAVADAVAEFLGGDGGYLSCLRTNGSCRCR